MQPLKFVGAQFLSLLGIHLGTKGDGSNMIEIKLRQSWINTFLRCPEQARQERFKLVKQKETSDLLRGNAVHHAIEMYGNGMFNPQQVVATDPISLEWMLDIGETYLADNAPKVEVWRHSYEKTVDTVLNNIEAWHNEVMPNLTPVAIEKSFEVSLGVRDNVNLILTGTADWIDQSGAIWDWKNPGRKYEPWEKKRWDIQSHAYCLAFDATQFVLCVLVNGEVQIIEIERTDNDRMAFTDLCWSIVPTIMANQVPWPMNWGGWHCSPKWCPVWQAGECRGKHLGENPW